MPCAGCGRLPGMTPREVIMSATKSASTQFSSIAKLPATENAQELARCAPQRLPEALAAISLGLCSTLEEVGCASAGSAQERIKPEALANELRAELAHAPRLELISH